MDPLYGEVAGCKASSNKEIDEGIVDVSVAECPNNIFWEFDLLERGA